ncbi:hypothetical protein HII31_13457 [Pseudocercospora fuligena]|uniref:Uncharacterized protein n=1 Tax=Pseudocercospora fuligena TaxID=685502 RepID=A0A8H6R7E8_9PEZI|nr:hypothetical protein HII31_13457 [Pseudocercospora fuligena]
METPQTKARLSSVPQFDPPPTLSPEDERSQNETATALPQLQRSPSHASSETKEQCFPSPFSTQNVSRASVKQSPIITIVRSLTVSTLGADLGLARNASPPSWQPTFLRAFPLVGIGALLIAGCCVLASLGILIGSNGKATEDWQWPPSVFLAIFSAVANRVLQFALFQAVPISFWHKAWSGATIAELQRRWEATEGLFRAVRNARQEWMLALATIGVALVAIDGPLLQKSSSVHNVQRTGAVALNVPISPEIPRGFSGYFQEGIITNDEATPPMVEFVYNTTITANITGCNYGTCVATIHGPGVTVQNCSSKSWPLSRNDILNNKTAAWGPDGAMPLFTTRFKEVSMYPPYSGPEIVELQIGMANWSDCEGAFTLKACTLAPAILEYHIQIQHNPNRTGNTITFTKPPSQARLVALANNTHVNASQSPVPMTIGAFAAFLGGEIHANASMHVAADPRDTTAIMPDPNTFNNIAQKYSLDGYKCERSWSDPTQDIISDFNSILVRSGIAVASSSNTRSRIDPGLSINQTVTGQETRWLNVFRTDLRWFAGAAVFEILAIVAIIPVYFGWWKLGVRVTMSPLEIAKAFEAPLLNNVNSAAGSRGIVNDMGDVKIAFGTAEAKVVDERLGKEFTTSRLVIAEADQVVRPRRGMRFDE